MDTMTRFAYFAAALLVVCSAAAGEGRARSDRLEDFDAFCRFVADDNASFELKKTDWPAACAASRPKVVEAVDRSAFIGVVERTLAELYNAHAHFGTSTPKCPRLVPTDADLYARWQGAEAIAEVGAASMVLAAGLQPGLRALEIDGRSVEDVVAAAMPQHLTALDPAARDWALRVALAGHQDRKAVQVRAELDGRRGTFAFVPKRTRPDRPLTATRVGTVGVIEIHDALDDSKLVPSFGEARETGIFHVWNELVGHWTGSMGEGIAIGLNAMRGAPVIGAPMAGLLGALDELKRAHAGVVARIPAERLFHVDGTPREAFVPCTIDNRDADADLRQVVAFASQLAEHTAARCP